jgi:hypothetical protein
MNVRNIAVTNVDFQFALLVTSLISIVVFERPKSVVITEPLWGNGIVFRDETACGGSPKEKWWEEINVSKSPQTGREI